MILTFNFSWVLRPTFVMFSSTVHLPDAVGYMHHLLLCLFCQVQWCIVPHCMGYLEWIQSTITWASLKMILTFVFAWGLRPTFVICSSLVHFRDVFVAQATLMIHHLNQLRLLSKSVRKCRHSLAAMASCTSVCMDFPWPFDLITIDYYNLNITYYNIICMLL